MGLASEVGIGGLVSESVVLFSLEGAIEPVELLVFGACFG
jgi:hypothetical protein